MDRTGGQQLYPMFRCWPLFFLIAIPVTSNIVRLAS